MRSQKSGSVAQRASSSADEPVARIWIASPVLPSPNRRSGYSGDLASAGFGQPTSRATQVFGSGGPRAFQLAMRVSF